MLDIYRTVGFSYTLSNQPGDHVCQAGRAFAWTQGKPASLSIASKV